MKKKIAIIAISSFLLVALVVAVVVPVTLRLKKNHDSENDGQELSATAKAVKALCQPTDYKEVCEETLTKAGANTTDPKELVKIAFDVGKQYVSEAAKKSVSLKELAKEPRTSAALENCRELMEFAINDFNKSLNKFDNFEMSKVGEMVEDLQIWISATITYQETCLDGFENTTGDYAQKMKDALKTSSELSSNLLAMFTETSAIFPSIKIPDMSSSRRLLQVLGHKGEAGIKDYPSWVSNDRRRLLAANQIKPQVTVAKDGSGNYKTIGEALKQVPKNGKDTYVVYIKEGVYVEQVTVENSMTNVMFLGDGPTKTRISGKLSFADGTPTLKTSTVIVLGDFFMAKDIGFENTAGPEGHQLDSLHRFSFGSNNQAVALRVQSDFSVFYNCRMDGYQDTLYVHTDRQFYRDCTISGTVDFIFGDAAVVLQNCQMVVRQPLDNQFCAVTAQGRKERRQPTGIVIQGGKITAARDYSPQIKTYLGRPWKPFARTVIMGSFLDSLISPEGWTPWAGNVHTNTCFYAEYKNSGPGSSTAQRVKWIGIKQLTPQNVVKYTPKMFLRGDQWVPQKGIPYTSGLN